LNEDPDAEIAPFYKGVDTRSSIGRCFAPEELTVKYADKQKNDVYYGFAQTNDMVASMDLYIGLFPDQWFKLRGETFSMSRGSILYGGPVVEEGRCEKIERPGNP
jgi:hypothetical protein